MITTNHALVVLSNSNGSASENSELSHYSLVVTVYLGWDSQLVVT